MKIVNPNHSLKRSASIALGTVLLTLFAGIIAPAARAATCVPGPGADLTGCDFKGADLQKVNLTGANLKNADLSGANLTSANLKNARLEGTVAVGTNFTSANLTGVGLSETDFSQANLTKATLANAYLSLAFDGMKPINFSGATIQSANLKFNIIPYSLSLISSGNLIGRPKALPTDYKIVKGYFVGPYANLSGANLYGANFGSVNCIGCNFTGASLSTANFGSSNLSGANLKNANLGTALLNQANLANVRSGGIGSLPALPQNWAVVKGYLVGPYASLANADLSNTTISASMQNVNLTNANLSNSTVTGSLEGASMQDTNLANATITGSMQNAEIFRANLTDVDLSASDLKGLEQTFNTQYEKETGTAKALPNGWIQVKGILLGPGVKINYGDLTSSDLSKLDLTGANFYGSNLSSSNLSGTNLKNSDFRNTNLSGSNLSNADLSESVLDNVNFSDADLTDTVLAGAQLKGSNLDDVELDFADLNNISSGNLSGSPSLPDLWALQNGYLIGPGANLTNAKLGGASLDGVSLVGATLTGMRPWDSYNSKGVSGTPVSIPANWTLDSTGILVGPGVDLFGADLTKKPLATWNLAGASLAGANISGSNVYGADLSNVILTTKNRDDDRTYGVKGCDLNGGVTLPPKWHLIGGCLVGPGANLSNQNLAGLDLSGLDLSGANFYQANLTAVTTSRDKLGTNFEGANFYDANLTGADLTYSDLDKADFRAANLTRTNLSNSSLHNATFFAQYYEHRSALLNQTIVQNIAGSPNLWSYYTGSFSKYKILRGNLVGPYLDLSNANLIGVDFSGVDLTGSTITTARLEGVTWGSVKCPDQSYGSSHIDGSCLKDALKWQSAQPTPSISGTPNVGNVVCAVPGTRDNGVTLSYDWRVDGQPVSEVGWWDGTCLTIRPDFLGKSFKLTITGKKYGYYDQSWTSTVITVGLGTIPTPDARISGTLKNGNTLTFDSWFGSNFTYYHVKSVTAWLRDGQPIPTSSSNTYTLTQADIGKKISVSYQITAAGYTTLNATTAQTTPIAGADLTLTPVPSILGTIKSGSRLTAAPGQWNAGVTFTYQWLRNGAPISGATSSGYTLTKADIGQNIAVTVTGSLAGYTSVSKTSVTVKPLSIRAKR